jgi:hypothetical protein
VCGVVGAWREGGRGDEKKLRHDDGAHARQHAAPSAPLGQTVLRSTKKVRFVSNAPDSRSAVARRNFKFIFSDAMWAIGEYKNFHGFFGCAEAGKVKSPS